MTVYQSITDAANQVHVLYQQAVLVTELALFGLVCLWVVRTLTRKA